MAPLLLGAAMVLIGAGPAQADEPATVQATQSGWWNRLQGPQEGEPAGNPLRPAIPRLPAPPTVPADSIAVGASAGQVDKVAAVGIDVLVPVGGTIDALTLHLKQSPANGSNINADVAKVSACPIKDPWGADKNANWVDRPQADCDKAKVDAVRGSEGDWSFDLTPIGGLWADPASGLLPNGVLLTVEPVPATVQVSWLDVEAGGATLDVVATSPPETEPGSEAFSGEAAAGPTETVPFASTEAPVDSGYGVGSSDSSSFSDSYLSSQPELETAAPVEPVTPAPAAAPPAAPFGRRLHTRPVVWGNLSPSSVLLLPTVLVLALLLGWALGPVGRPAPVHRREGGLSRALARRRAGLSVSETSPGGIS